MALGRLKTVMQTNSKNTGTIIFFHGSGQTGEGICNWIQQIIGPFSLPHIKFIFPTAPLQKYSAWNNQPARVWFNRSNVELNIPDDIESLKHISSAISLIIQQEISTGVPLHKIILGGFSMGGALALQMGYNFSPGVKGVFALSAFLNSDSNVYTALQNKPLRQTPLLMCHGDRDDVVPMEWGKFTFEKLVKLGVQGKFIPVPRTYHGLDGNEVRELFEWIRKLLPDE